MLVLYVFWGRRLYYSSVMLQFLHVSVHVFKVALPGGGGTPIHYL